MALRQGAVHGDDRAFLAGMRARRKPDRPAGDQAGELGHDPRICRRRRRIELDVAGDDDAGRAEPRQPRGILGGLGEAQGEAFEQAPDDAGHLLPALVRAVRHAPVDHHERDITLAQRHDRVRPDFGFRNEGHVGLPVVEETSYITWHVERDKLMHGSRRQAPGDQGGGGPGAGGDQNREAPLGHAFHHRQKGEGLADAGAMDPDQMALGPLPARIALPLAEARLVLTPFALAPVEEAQHRRLHRGDDEAVRSEKDREAHARESLMSTW